MREDLLAAIPGTVEALTHFPAVLSPILQRRKKLLILDIMDLNQGKTLNKA